MGRVVLNDYDYKNIGRSLIFIIFLFYGVFIFRIVLILLLSRVDLLSTSNSYDIFSSISISVSNSPPVSTTSNRMSDTITLTRNNIGAIVNINSVLYENPRGLIDFICEKPIDDKNKYRLLIAHV